VSEIMEFCHDPIQAGLRALKEGAGIFTDIKMVEIGIVKKGHKSVVETMLGAGDDLAASSGITRTSAGVFALQNELSGAIIVMGNAPSALMTLCELIESGRIKTALVIGTPVGFVNADKSKERLRATQVPSVSTVGTRGGTPIAVAAINEIINMHSRAGS
jgi:precorrin-8X/cobalt-precorrin-8 methylmutase